MQAILFILLIVLSSALCPPAHAQRSEKLPRIGFVSSELGFDSFKKALLEVGYIEGKNIMVEYRNTIKRGQIQQFVTELVNLKMDVLVITPQPGIRAAKQATKTIPIVMVTTQDPVALGFVDSLARPGGNITGVTTLQRELSGKRLEVLREALPGITRVGALMNATSTGDFKMYERPAHALKIQLLPIGVQGSNPDIESLFQSAVRERADAMIAITNAVINPRRKRIAEVAIKNRLPLMAERGNYVDAGALMSYAADNDASYRRAALYVDKILKGAKPRDLPIEQPSKFELVINLKTAKQIGLTIPPNVLARADRVIK